MEELVEALEEHAGELKEYLETEAVILQKRVNQAVEYGEDSRVYNLRRGEVRRQVDKLQDVYDEAKAVVELGTQLGIAQPEEQREEEFRLAKEKWFDSHIENPYKGRIGEAVDEHMEQQRMARYGDILTHSTPILGLNNTLKTYDLLLYEVGNTMEGIEVETEFEPQEYDSDFIEDMPEQNSDEPLDLSEHFFSQRF